MKTEAWVAIRQNEEGEWIDVTTVSQLREYAKKLADDYDKEVPIFAKYNPISGIRLITIEVIP